MTQLTLENMVEILENSGYTVVPRPVVSDITDQKAVITPIRPEKLGAVRFDTEIRYACGDGTMAICHTFKEFAPLIKKAWDNR